MKHHQVAARSYFFGVQPAADLKAAHFVFQSEFMEKHKVWSQLHEFSYNITHLNLIYSTKKANSMEQLVTV